MTNRPNSSQCEKLVESGLNILTNWNFQCLVMVSLWLSAYAHFDKKVTTVEEVQQWRKMEEKRNKWGKNKANGPWNGSLRKEVISLMANMARMIASKPIGTIRDKSKTNGLEKPKGRTNKPNGPTWQEWQPLAP